MGKGGDADYGDAEAMKLHTIDTVIARRTLETKDGREVEIVIGAPQPLPDHADYFCPFQVKVWVMPASIMPAEWIRTRHSF